MRSQTTSARVPLSLGSLWISKDQDEEDRPQCLHMFNCPGRLLDTVYQLFALSMTNICENLLNRNWSRNWSGKVTWLRKQRNYIDFRLVYIPRYPYISHD